MGQLRARGGPQQGVRGPGLPAGPGALEAAAQPARAPGDGSVRGQGSRRRWVTLGPASCCAAMPPPAVTLIGLREAQVNVIPGSVWEGGIGGDSPWNPRRAGPSAEGPAEHGREEGAVSPRARAGHRAHWLPGSQAFRLGSGSPPGLGRQRADGRTCHYP